MEVLNARGPLLGPLVLLVMSDRIGASFQTNVSFIMSRYNDPLFSMQKYEWVIKGWSRCSKECGGGFQRLILRYVKVIVLLNVQFLEPKILKIFFLASTF